MSKLDCAKLSNSLKQTRKTKQSKIFSTKQRYLIAQEANPKIIHPIENSIMAFVYQGDPELESKSKKAAERISENMHIVANEPSLALYRLQEHVRKALPPMVERRVEVTKLQHELQGRCYDVEYALSAVKSMDGAATSFKNIQEMLKQSIFLKQQLKYEEARRNKKDSNSVYKRLSAHIVLDLPDLSEFSMVRETTNRIENMMAQARGSSAELHRSHTTLH